MNRWIRRSLVVVASALFANGHLLADPGNTKTAIGFYALGGEFTTGTPTVRWHPSDRVSFDVSPIVAFSDSKSDGPLQTKLERYGLSVGFVKNLATAGGLVAGLRFEGSYDYRYDTLGSSNRPFSARGSGYDLSFGIGPDFEYFIPGLSNLSLGAQGVFGYTQSYHRILSTSADFQQDATVGFRGADFTVRYYFR